MNNLHTATLESKSSMSPACKSGVALVIALIGCGGDGSGEGSTEITTTTTTTTTTATSTTTETPTSGPSTGGLSTSDSPTTSDSGSTADTETTAAESTNSTDTSSSTGEEPSSTGSGSSSGDTSTGEPRGCYDDVLVPGGGLSFGGVAGEEPGDLAVGADGSRYSCGNFFGPGTDLKPGGGAPFPTEGFEGNMWFNKLAADGSYVYGYTWPGTNPDYFSSLWGIEPTVDGGVVLVGSYAGALDLDPGDGVDMHPAADGSIYGASNAFMIKFDAAGDYQWGRSWGGTVASAHAVTEGPDGALYVVGHLEGESDLDPGPGVAAFTANAAIEGFNTSDGYLIKFDPDGGFLWARVWGGDLDGQVDPYHVALDSGGNVVVAGRLAGIVDLDPGPGMQVHEAADHSSFAMRFTADSAWDWSFAVGDKAEFSGLTIGRDDRIWLVGGFYGDKLDLDPGPGDTGYTNDPYEYDGFFARYSPTGSYELSGVVSSPAEDSLQSIAADCDGDELYIVGSFEASIDLDPGPGVATHFSGGSSDPYVLAIDGDGAYRWSRSWPGSSPAFGYRIAVDAEHMVHAQFNYQASIDADAGPGVAIVQSAGERDILLEKLNPGSGDW